MATFFDMRQAGDDEAKVKLEVYTNKDGNVVINLNDGKPNGRDEREPEMFLLLGLLEAKQLRAALDETIKEAITAIAE
jgi:hypothetical protein